MFSVPITTGSIVYGILTWLMVKPQLRPSIRVVVTIVQVTATACCGGMCAVTWPYSVVLVTTLTTTGMKNYEQFTALRLRRILMNTGVESTHRNRVLKPKFEDMISSMKC